MMKRIAIIGGIALSGCTSVPAKNDKAGLANPASAYCVEQGGNVEIRKESSGEVGYCHLPEGRVVEEWAFFRARGK